MPRGASPKREREYQELERKFKEEGRYPGREEEVAARVVNKQRAGQGESKQQAPRSGSGHLRAHTTRARRGAKSS